MSILWCGGEEIDFPNGSVMLNTTNDTYYRAGYARCGLYKGAFAYSNAVLDTITSGWLSFRSYLTNAVTSAYDVLLCGLVGEGKTGYWIKKTGGQCVLLMWNGTEWTTLATESGTSFAPKAVVAIHMQIIGYGGSGNIKVYFENALLIDYYGTLSIAGLSGFTRVGIYGTGTLSSAYISEIIVADEDTRTMSLCTLAPAGNGAHTDMTGDYTAVDEVALNTADKVYSDTDGHQESFTLADLPASDFTIKAVKVAAHATKSSDATPQQLKIGVRSGSTTDVDDTHALTLGWSTVERLMPVNPVTSAAFTPAEVDALELAMEVEA